VWNTRDMLDSVCWADSSWDAAEALNVIPEASIWDHPWIWKRSKFNDPAAFSTAKMASFHAFVVTVAWALLFSTAVLTPREIVERRPFTVSVFSVLVIGGEKEKEREGGISDRGK